MKLWRLGSTQILLSLITALLCTACSSSKSLWEKQEEGNPRAAAYAGEAMHWTKEYKNRPYVRWEFYYKHCTTVNRSEYPTPDSWDCSAPF